MAMVINSNVMSLNAQRNLTRSNDMLATSLQRLSSGLRVNSAKDDAAGFAISQRFETQIRGLNQAVRNANDGISLSQTAEAALGEVTGNLQRIRELAVQAANSSYSASDRAALDAEVSQRLAEIDRISTQTTFNGQKVLDGSFGQASFQVGANVGDTISVDLTTGSRTNQLGDAVAVVNGGALPGAGATATTGGDFSIQVGTAAAVDVSFAAGDTASQVVEKIKSAGVDGLSAWVNAGGTISLRASEDVTVGNGSGGGAAADVGLTAGATTAASDTSDLSAVTVATVDGANDAIIRIDQALSTVSGIQGDLGAIQNRFSSTIANLSAVSENLTASNSRIVDADFAAETASLTKAQILQQAGVSILAQANAVPQTVLGLLR